MRYWSDGTEELEETDLAGTEVRRRYTYGTVIDEVCRMDTFTNGTYSTSFYYHTNHQGTVYTVTDSGGVVKPEVPKNQSWTNKPEEN